MHKTYYICYTVVIKSIEGLRPICNKGILVKNQFNELGAKVNLEKYLRRKYGDAFYRLEIESCQEDAFGLFSAFTRNRPF